MLIDEQSQESWKQPNKKHKTFLGRAWSALPPSLYENHLPAFAPASLPTLASASMYLRLATIDARNSWLQVSLLFSQQPPFSPPTTSYPASRRIMFPREEPKIAVSPNPQPSPPFQNRITRM